MLVCIDESGCTGFKFDRGSSQYFFIAMVIFDDFKQAEKCSKAIDNLSSQLKIKNEFKFNKSHANVKEAFFLTVKKYDFTVQAIVVDKREILSSRLHYNKAHFYRYVMAHLMQSDCSLKEAIVKIDGNGDKVFRKKWKQYLSQYLGSGAVKKVRFVDSRKDNLIQLADMVVGAIALHYTDHQDSGRWVRILDKKLSNIVELCRPRNLV